MHSFITKNNQLKQNIILVNAYKFFRVSHSSFFFQQDAVLHFMRDVFSFDKVRYTTVEQLADDILVLARAAITDTMQQMTS